MSIKQDIQTFTEKLNVKFALAHSYKLLLLSKDIQRFIKKDFEQSNSLQITSQDLRSLIIVAEKVHKELNKKISFVEFQKRFYKYDKVGKKEFEEETKKFVKYCATLQNMQTVMYLLNHSATTVYFIELQKEQEAEKGDCEFTNSIIEALKDY